MTLHTVPVSVDPARTYRYYRGGTYRPLGVARNAHTYQEQVVYVGVSGSDAESMFVCPLVDWSLKFELVEEEVAAVNGIPERVVGPHSGKAREDRTGEQFI